MTSEKAAQADAARAAGLRWAEQKAETLQGEVPAVNWPDYWNPVWAGSLPFGPDEVREHDLETLRAIGNHAAAERWAQLVTERRELEDAGDEELDTEADAVHLLESIRDGLPEGLGVRREGERVYLFDQAGMERTVTSLGQAWRVVDEWRERRSL